mgnify:CR=1 FL=1
MARTGKRLVRYRLSLFNPSGRKDKSRYTPKDTMTKEQEKAFRNLFSMLEVFFGELKLSGHNNHTNAKACPSFKMRDKFGDLINR